MLAPLVLSLDLGSSSFRAALYRLTGRMVRGSLVSVSIPELAPGVLNPRQAAEAVDTLLDNIQAHEAASNSSILAVGLSAFWHSLMGVDVAGEPVTPLYLWSDLRSTPDAAQLRTELDDAALHDRTGAALHPTFWPAKLRWILRTAPDQWHKVSAWVSFADYLYLRWFGEARTSLSMASATGLLDQDRLSWDAKMLEAASLDPERLPPLADLPTPLAGFSERYATRWPSLRRAFWLPAIGDGAASNLGVGAVGRASWAITVGTSAAVRAILTEPPGTLPMGLWRYRIDARRPVLGGALNNGGNLHAWLRRTLRLPPLAVLDQQLLERPWGAHGLRVDPSIFGERSPYWPLDATGSITGLTGSTTAVDIAQALLEAVAERIAAITSLMERALGRPERIVATGRALARSAAWRRMLEEVLGRSVEPSPVLESSLRGAALLAIEEAVADSPARAVDTGGPR